LLIQGTAHAQVCLFLIFIEYATSAEHYKNMYTDSNEKKDIKHWKKHIHSYTHKNTIKSKA